MENIVSAESQAPESFEVTIPTLENAQLDIPANGSPDSSVHTNTDKSPELEIDERFKELPREEAIKRTLQSQRDKIYADYNKLNQTYTERDQVAGLFDEMIEDEGLLMAFISEVKPDLVKQRDLAGELRETLKKEFGDFKPQLSREEAEREDPFGQDSKYYMRIDELKQKLKGQDAPQAKSVKEYLAKKRQAQLEADRKYAMERDAVKAQKKMSDEELKAVSDWALTLKFDQIVDIHRYLRKSPVKNPTLTNVTGDHPGKKSARDLYLDEVLPMNGR